MKKKNYILREVGVLLVAAIFVLTSIVIVPMTIAETPPAHDVGVSDIIYPISVCASDWDDVYPVEVRIQNFGTDLVCCFKVNVEINGPASNKSKKGVPSKIDSRLSSLDFGDTTLWISSG